jgi:beta-N-acetylhexosaminidase
MDWQRVVARMFAVGFPSTETTPDMRDLIDRGLGGAVLFKRNFADGQRFADLCAQLKTLAGRPFITCIDQEGGRVTRLGKPFTQIPSMRIIGSHANAAMAREIGQLMASELRAANIDMNLSPVLDVDTNPANPVIGDRSFGRSVQTVMHLGLAMIDGLQSTGIAACAKHFPGHGDTSQDSHYDLPRLPHAMSRLQEIELLPFVKATEAGVAAIMTAHVIFEAIDDQYPATMSKQVLDGLLRKQIGFDGVIVSDDLGMNAIAGNYDLEHVVIRCTNAGVDLFLMAHDAEQQNRAIDLLAAAVQRGDVDGQIIQAANRRLDKLFDRYVRPPTTGPLGPMVGCAKHHQLMHDLTELQRAPDPTEYRPAER